TGGHLGCVAMRNARTPLRTVGPISSLVPWTSPTKTAGTLVVPAVIVSPGAGREARLPVQQELRCEAPTGVADPITTWSGGLVASARGGRTVPVSRKAHHTGELVCFVLVVVRGGVMGTVASRGGGPVRRQERGGI